MVSKRDSKIVGFVSDTKGNPIAGAKVECNGKHTSTLFDGTYRFESLIPSTYTVIVMQKGFQRQEKKTELGEDEIITLDFRLNPKKGFGKIHGYVFDSNTGDPITSGGTMILVLPFKNKHSPISSKDGYFEILELPSDTYDVWASILGYEDECKRISLKENEEKRVDYFCRKKEAVEPPWG